MEFFEFWTGTVRSGTGGATKAFEYKNGRRQKEIGAILGFLPYPGSLNVYLECEFDWDEPEVTGELLDVVEFDKGLDVEWQPRMGRFYRVEIEGIEAWVFRFVGERYLRNFIELLAPVRLRDLLDSDEVTVCRASR